MKLFVQRITFLVLSFVLICGVAQAIESPVPSLNKVANQMIDALKQHKSELRQSNHIIYGIVNRILVPHVDLERMATAVVGRQYWNSATATQRSSFIKEFTHLVTSTYAAALASYNDDVIQFYPLRGNFQSNHVLTVRSVIIRKNGQRIGVDYNVVNHNGTWRIYDFSIENVSMVQSYRSQIASYLASGGMNGLLQKLKAHNIKN